MKLQTTHSNDLKSPLIITGVLILFLLTGASNVLAQEQSSEQLSLSVVDCNAFTDDRGVFVEQLKVRY